MVAIVIAASFTAYVARLSLATTPGGGPPKPRRVNATFMYFDYAYITYVNGSSAGKNSTAYFDIPTNYSDGVFNQTVYIVAYGGNVSVGGSKDNTTVSIDLFNGSQGFVVAKVVDTFPNDTALITFIANHPTALNFSTASIPSSIRKEYVKKPAKVVVKYVVPAFRKWLGKILSRSNSTFRNVSKAFIAVLAAYFIYLSGYIHYSASSMPRTLNETVIKRVGDCDDMSRVLTNLLWYYGIPAKINYGYVYIPSFNMTATLEGSAMRFINNGPHAFVSAYIPGVKWVSLDFLAGSLLSNPFLIQYASTKAVVTKKDVENMKKELLQFRYAEEIQVYEDHIVPAYLNTTNTSKLLKVLHREALPVIALAKPKPQVVSTTTTTTSTATTTPINTASTTPSTTTTTTTTPSRGNSTSSTTRTTSRTGTTTTSTSTTETTVSTAENVTNVTAENTSTAVSTNTNTSTTTQKTTTETTSTAAVNSTTRQTRTGTSTTLTLRNGAEANTTSTSRSVATAASGTVTSGSSRRSETSGHVATATTSGRRAGSATVKAGSNAWGKAYVLGFAGCLAAFALVVLIIAVVRPSVRVSETAA